MSFFKSVEIIMQKSPLGKQDKEKILDFKQEDAKLGCFLPSLNL